jgi:dTMP kinase
MTEQRAPFIVFEGGEGSGKSFHTRLTAEYLTEQGVVFETAHEPGGTVLGKDIRALLVERMDLTVYPTTELFLFLADRAQHVQEFILPRLEDGTVVLCDRFTGSTLAYQIGGRELPEPELIIQMEQYARSALEPDIVFYLDVDPEIGIARKQKQLGKETNRIDNEHMEFHAKVRRYFQSVAKDRTNWVQLDANRTLEEVQKEINEQIDRVLKS